MLTIQASSRGYRELNEAITAAQDQDILLEGVLGQRFLGAGLSEKSLTIQGIPGNALGAYLDGARIHVCGNAQDATGDTMNDGQIIIDGSCGDAAGYAMRGGRIYIRGNAGYRAGIHMKAYQEKLPVMVIGGRVGSFLGEYQAGGIIIVLGLGEDGVPVGNFCGTGMHGGRIYLRTASLPADLPSQVAARQAEPADLEAISPILEDYGRHFGLAAQDLEGKPFYVLEPNTQNPYHQLYTPN